MKLKEIIIRLERELLYAKTLPEVKKPMSHALYQVWIWCNANEKEKE